MKFSTLPAIGMVLLIAPLATAAEPKTATPVPINPGRIGEEPFRFNGIVHNAESRGSGFCAWNKRTFFSAAHVVFGETEWLTPPTWYPAANSDTLDKNTAIQSRGYYRWANYAELAVEPSNAPGFSRDVILGFAFEKLIKGPGRAATLNLNGIKDLREKRKTLITGYPADNPYLDEKIAGYFMYQTGPVITPYRSYAGRALTTTLVTTGHGNSGGPIWTKNSNKTWSAAGVLVGGLPSESVVYAFSKDINALTRAVAPVVKPDIEEPIRDSQVSSSSTFFPYNRVKEIPDGRHEWTSFRINVNGFPEGSTVKAAKLSLDIQTRHRGDLQVMLEGPGGASALVHNEQGAGKNNLVFKDRDYSKDFADIVPNGTWTLHVQDRLVGDIATLQSILLEISVDGEDIAAP
jgi:subtilisin-like proprotein convertase family protein